jgi:hypothetical protein
MKTAMQELIEEILCEQEIYFDENGDFLKVPNIQYVNAYKSDVDLSEYINKAVEKEKEQIIDAYYAGVKLLSGDIESAAKHYYYQTYNQNK